MTVPTLVTRLAQSHKFGKSGAAPVNCEGIVCSQSALCGRVQPAALEAGEGQASESFNESIHRDYSPSLVTKSIQD